MKRSHRQVAVILNADVADVGFAGELRTVKAGYARNFLLAKDVAELATPERRTQRAAELAKADARRQAETGRLEELAATIAAEPIKLTLGTGPGGQVFGSLTAADVAEAAKEQHNITLDPKQLSGLPIKTLGPTSVSAKLGVGVTAEVPLEVTGKLVRKKGADDDDAGDATSDDDADVTAEDDAAPDPEQNPEPDPKPDQPEAVATPS